VTGLIRRPHHLSVLSSVCVFVCWCIYLQVVVVSLELQSDRVDQEATPSECVVKCVCVCMCV
jgi:hypothetical protein